MWDIYSEFAFSNPIFLILVMLILIFLTIIATIIGKLIFGIVRLFKKLKRW